MFANDLILHPLVLQCPICLGLIRKILSRTRPTWGHCRPMRCKKRALQIWCKVMSCNQFVDDEFASGLSGLDAKKSAPNKTDPRLSQAGAKGASMQIFMYKVACNIMQQCNIHQYPGELQARLPGTGTSGTSSGQKRADARDESLLLSEGNVFMVLREACWRRSRFLSEDFACTVAKDTAKWSLHLTYYLIISTRPMPSTSFLYLAGT